MRFENETSHNDPVVKRLISQFPELAQADRDGRRYHFFIEQRYGARKKILIDAVEMKWTMLEKIAQAFPQAHPTIGKNAHEHVLFLDYEAVENPELAKPGAHVAAINDPVTVYHYSKDGEGGNKHFLVVEKTQIAALRKIAKEYKPRALNDGGADDNQKKKEGVTREFLKTFSRFSLSQQQVPEDFINGFLAEIAQRQDVRFVDLRNVAETSTIPALIAANKQRTAEVPRGMG